MKNRALPSLVFAAATLPLHSWRRRRSRPRRPTAKPEEGIPITRCDRAEGVRVVPSARRQGADVAHFVSAQHARGLAVVIQRMASLNGLNIEPETARQVVKYLSNNLGLAPEEARPAAWECGAAADRLQVHRERRRRIDLQQVPLARPRDCAAPHRRPSGIC